MKILVYLQIVLAILLTLSILVQSGTSGLGTLFGGSVVEGYRSKRGFEAFIYNLSIILGVLFIANTIAISIVSA